MKQFISLVMSIATFLWVAAEVKKEIDIQAEYDALLVECETALVESKLLLERETFECANTEDTASSLEADILSTLNDEVVILELSANAAEVEEETECKAATGFNIETYEDIYNVQINKSYDIPAEFYYDILPETMYPIVESVCELESNMEISSMFLLAVAATEVGWGNFFSEENNWYNWTPDAEMYQYFDSPETCVNYTGVMFTKKFFNPEWYTDFGQTMDDYFTVAEVNTRYALNNDLSVNWAWTDVVSEIMYSFNKKYQAWVANEV